MEPQIRFCTSADGTRIAYSTYGEPGLQPVVNVHMWGVVEDYVSTPEDQSYYGELASDRQAVRFDRRGIGASQRETDDFSLEAQVADLAAVVDAAGFATFDMAGAADGAAVAAVYAARHPERISRLVLSEPYCHGAEMAQPEQTHSIVTLIHENWPLARRALASFFAPGGSAEAQREVSRTLRDAIGADSAAGYIEWQNNLDVRRELAELRTPTLVLRPVFRGRSWSAHAVSVAGLVPGARLVTLESPDLMGIARALRKFFDEAPATERPDTVASGTAIILFADIADSTALTERLGDTAFREKARDLDAALRELVRGRSGTPIEGKLLGDGVLATFASAKDAIESAVECARSGDQAGLPLHVGLHAGDVIREESNVFGGAVNIASRISGLAAPGEVLVSQTVRDLARTSAGVSFEDRGEQSLKGVGEAVRVFAVRASVA